MSTTTTKSRKTKKTKTPSPTKPPAKSPAKLAGVPRDFDALARHLGPHDEAFATRTFATATEAALVERGTEVDSRNILDDMLLFIASSLEITASLTPSQRPLLRLPPAIYPLLVHETIVLRGMKSDHDDLATTGAADKADRTTQERAARIAAIALRDSVYDALRSALGPQTVAELDIVTGIAPSTTKLAAGLTSLAAFIDRKRALGADVAASLDDYRVGAECADSLRRCALDLTALGKITPSPARRISQRALDLQDGRILHLVERIVRAFRAARRTDPTILQPTLNKLAWLFDRPSKPRPTPETDDAHTTTEASPPPTGKPNTPQPA